MCKHINQNWDQRAKSADLRKKITGVVMTNLKKKSSNQFRQISLVLQGWHWCLGALRASCRAVGGSKNLKAEGSKKKKGFMEGKFCFWVLPKSGGGRRGQLPPQPIWFRRPWDPRSSSTQSWSWGRTRKNSSINKIMKFQAGYTKMIHCEKR